MNDAPKFPRVVEKYYSPRELSVLLGFSPDFFRDEAKAGSFTLTVDGSVVCEAVEIGGELRIPATAVNAWLVAHPYRYDAGVKARNAGELRRKLRAADEPVAA
jgi:hypothetical protein